MAIVDKDQFSDPLAHYLPSDRIFGAKFRPTANIRNLVRGLAQEVARVENKFRTIDKETDLNQTNELLVEWERAYGIPDDCFVDLSTLTTQQRINQVLAKIRALGVATAQDFIDIGTLLGVTITIDTSTPGPRERFIWVIESNWAQNYPPYDLPYSFDTVLSPEQCFFQKLSPANTILLFEESP